MDHASVVTGVAIAATGLTVVSSCADGTVWRWTAGDDSGQRLCDEGPRANAVAITPDGDAAVSAHDDGCLVIWDLSSGRSAARLKGHEEPATKVGLTTAGRAVSLSRLEKRALLWDLGEGRAVSAFDSPPDDDAGQMHSLALTGDGSVLLTGSSFGVHVWDVALGARRAFWNTGGPYTLGICTIHGDRTVVVGRMHRALDLWSIDAAPGPSLVAPPRMIAVGADVWGVVPAGGPRVLVALDSGRVELWDLDDERRLGEVHAHARTVIDISIAADGRTAATASADGTAAIVDVEQLWPMRRHSAAGS
jgi:WD40 repeat protein